MSDTRVLKNTTNFRDGGIDDAVSLSSLVNDVFDHIFQNGVSEVSCICAPYAKRSGVDTTSVIMTSCFARARVRAMRNCER